MPEDWARLDRDLRELEARDPEVRAARKRLDDTLTPHEVWRRQMVHDLWAEPEEAPCPTS